jgi:hypothetical protein
MKLFKAECPACGQTIEAPETMLTAGVKCPACQTGFVPEKPRFFDPEQSFAPPAGQPLREQLEALRAQSAYPNLREAIQVIYSLGLGIFGVGALGAFFFAIFKESGIAALGGLVCLLLFLAWLAISKSFACLLIDVAYACIHISRR